MRRKEIESEFRFSGWELEAYTVIPVLDERLRGGTVHLRTHEAEVASARLRDDYRAKWIPDETVEGRFVYGEMARLERELQRVNLERLKDMSDVT